MTNPTQAALAAMTDPELGRFYAITERARARLSPPQRIPVMVLLSEIVKEQARRRDEARAAVAMFGKARAGRQHHAKPSASTNPAATRHKTLRAT